MRVSRVLQLLAELHVITTLLLSSFIKNKNPSFSRNQSRQQNQHWLRETIDLVFCISPTGLYQQKSLIFIAKQT